MNKKLLEIMKRQGELASKAATEKLTDEEKEELSKIKKAIEAMTNPSIEIGKTTLAVMSLAEFKKHVGEEQNKADLDPGRLSLLKRNLESVKKQGKTKADDSVAVEVFEQQSSDDRIDGIESKLDEVLGVLKTFDGRTNTGVVGDGTNGSPAGAATSDDADPTSAAAKGDSPTSEALAKEAIDSIIKRFQALKDKITNNEEFTVKELDEVWPGWELREMIAATAEVLAKLDEAKKLVEEVSPKLNELSKLDNAGDNASDKPGSKNKSDEEPEDVSKWASGCDMAPSSNATDSFKMLKKKSTPSF